MKLVVEFDLADISLEMLKQRLAHMAKQIEENLPAKMDDAPAEGFGAFIKLADPTGVLFEVGSTLRTESGEKHAQGIVARAYISETAFDNGHVMPETMREYCGSISMGVSQPERADDEVLS